MPANKSPKPKTVAKAVRKARKAPAKTTKVKLLSGGNPQIPLGYGDQPVQDYINAMPEWKQDIGRWLDRVITRTLPEVQKAVKWNTPFYGIEGQGWFLGFHCLTKYVKVAFFKGAHLDPKPPGTSKQKDVRYLDIHENEKIDEKQFVRWVKQAAILPGEKL
ncbi:MAG TPA: DUF1801 domain-containing protein [Flavobacteriales bacterium]